MKKITVIGSGLSGSLLCNSLINFFDVSLLEIGSSQKFSIPSISFLNKKFAEVPTLCFGGGGTTNLWHNGLIPLNPRDIFNDSFRKILLDANTFIDDAAYLLNFSNSDFSNVYDALMHQSNILNSNNLFFKHGLDTIIYPKKYQRADIDSRVNCYYNVKTLSFDFNGDSLSSIRCISDGKIYTIKSDYFVVCAGALGTPAVLKRIGESYSGSLFKCGAGLIDHPVGFVGKVRFKKKVSSILSGLSLSDHDGFISRHPVRLKSPCGKYSGCAYFRPALTMLNKLEIYKYKSSIGAGFGFERLKKLFSLKIIHPDIVAEIFSHLFNVNIPGRVFNILFVGEQKKGDNYVDHKNDIITVNWSISYEELNIYKQMILDLKTMLIDLSDDINLNLDLTDDWLWSMAHHSGTVSVGSSLEDILDLNLKFKNLNNVFACDGSVLQEHSYANTGLTIGALALRLAFHIKERYA